jgi:hypothetical protein
MSVARSTKLWAGVPVCVVLAALGSGCGGNSSPTQPGPLRDRDAIIKALPQGVTLETPVVPDLTYGQSSKTVEEALASLQAYVRNNVIYDGGMGREIQFRAEGAKDAKAAEKSRKKIKSAPMVIILAKSAG